jgi:hypothetical protein
MTDLPIEDSSSDPSLPVEENYATNS